MILIFLKWDHSLHQPEATPSFLSHKVCLPTPWWMLSLHSHTLLPDSCWLILGCPIWLHALNWAPVNFPLPRQDWTTDFMCCLSLLKPQPFTGYSLQVALWVELARFIILEVKVAHFCFLWHVPGWANNWGACIYEWIITTPNCSHATLWWTPLQESEGLCSS